MEQALLEPVIIEDLVHIGEDLGREAGLVEGEIKSLLRVCERRGLVLTEAQVAQVRACADDATLERRLDCAITATTGDEVFANGTGT